MDAYRDASGKGELANGVDHCFFDQPKKLPLVFHADACMMAFDLVKKVALILAVLYNS